MSVKQSHHQLVMQAIKDNDLDSLKTLIDSRVPASLHHVIEAFCNATPEVFEYTFSKSGDLAANAMLLKDIVEGMNPTPLKRIPDRSLKYLYVALRSFNDDTLPILNRAIQTHKHELVRYILKIDAGKSVNPDDVLLGAVLSNNFQTAYDCIKFGARIESNNNRVLSTAAALGAYRMTYFLTALGGDLQDALANITSDAFVQKLDDNLQHTSGVGIAQTLKKLIDEQDAFDTPRYNLEILNFKTSRVEDLRKNVTITREGKTYDISLIHVLTADHRFDDLVNKSLFTKGTNLDLDNLLKINPETQLNVIETLTRQGNLKKLFNPHLWLGRETELKSLIKYHIPDYAVEKYSFNFPQVFEDIKSIEQSRKLASHNIPKLSRRRP